MSMSMGSRFRLSSGCDYLDSFVEVVVPVAGPNEDQRESLQASVRRGSTTEFSIIGKCCQRQFILRRHNGDFVSMAQAV